MPPQPTSAEAFRTSDLPARQLSVFHALRDGNKTDHEIVEHSGLLLQTVCGARNRLIQLGLVERTSLTREGPHGHVCAIWRLTHDFAGRASVDVRKTHPGQLDLIDDFLNLPG